MNARTHLHLDTPVDKISDVELLILIRKLSHRIDQMKMEYQCRRIMKGKATIDL